MEGCGIRDELIVAWDGWPGLLVMRRVAGGETVSCEAARAVYSNTNSAAYTVYREDQWQRRSKHTELES
jgi:hypothetical protein